MKPGKNDEFTALAHEVVRYEGDAAKLEDEEILLMERGETLKAALKEAQDHFTTTEGYVKEELGKIKERYINVAGSDQGIRRNPGRPGHQSGGRPAGPL